MSCRLDVFFVRPYLVTSSHPNHSSDRQLSAVRSNFCLARPLLGATFGAKSPIWAPRPLRPLKRRCFSLCFHASQAMCNYFADQAPSHAPSRKAMDQSPKSDGPISKACCSCTCIFVIILYPPPCPQAREA